ncbi:Imm51 family immunity protein [Bombiscardovia coagulans]|uniref:Immunity protein 31 n=1 Tax=Bombiscardovia coagulans TaxID=686666 RepID=A0A261EQV7_9BIFI|nr:Imm51 family immunity protein [Bombiscardovia coagulans]OZG49056.1 Immunity protein 31 [Bombiscardovia coagulans]
MNTSEWKDTIRPFIWVEHDEEASVCLTPGTYKAALFSTRAKEGFEGNGYDWASLAEQFLHQHLPKIQNSIMFDPEAEMFCAYSSDKDALRTFITAFKDACDDDTVIQEVFSTIELD